MERAQWRCCSSKQKRPPVGAGDHHNGRKPDQLKRMNINVVNRSPQGENALMPQNGVMPFQNETLNCTVRAVVKDGEPWFVAKDVCDALGYGNSRDALSKHVRDRWKNTVTIRDGITGNPEKAIINEAGLFALVMKSKMPKAVEFQDWVCEEVLPSIRKHGMYATGEKLMELLAQPENAIKVFRALKDEQDRRKELEAKMEEDAPKVLFCEAVKASSNSVLVGELAKILRQNGVPTGQNRLFAQLREEGYLGKVGENYNLPTQRSMDMGLFEIKKWSFTDPNGVNIVKRTTKVTGKGQMYFVNKFLAQTSKAV